MNMRDGSTRGLLVAILLLSFRRWLMRAAARSILTSRAPSKRLPVRWPEPSNSIDLGTVSSQTFSGHAGASGASVPVKLVFFQLFRRCVGGDHRV